MMTTDETVAKMIVPESMVTAIVIATIAKADHVVKIENETTIKRPTTRMTGIRNHDIIEVQKSIGFIPSW